MLSFSSLSPTGQLYPTKCDNFYWHWSEPTILQASSVIDHIYSTVQKSSATLNNNTFFKKFSASKGMFCTTFFTLTQRVTLT